MSDFHVFKDAVAKRFEFMHKNYQLFRVSTTDKNELWDLYLTSFKPEDNPMYKERTEHDCQCCKQFVRAVGDVVAIVDGQVVSVWNVDTEEPYQVVANALAERVEGKPVSKPFFHWERTAGTDKSVVVNENKTVTEWQHFYCEIPNIYVNADPGPKVSAATANKEVFQRGIETITVETVDTVIELIEQDSVYRGTEHLETIKAFKRLQTEAAHLFEMELDNFYWLNANKKGARIRNSVIGTLLVDISEGMELDKAVYKFGEKMAPGSYKRPKSIATPRMIQAAKEALTEAGYVESLPRRHATIDDITINNVLFADRSAKAAMDIFDEITPAVPVPAKSLDAVEEVPVDVFINTILPKAESLEIMVRNPQKGNFMTLIAPQNADAPNILQWGNNFSWSYTGEVTDSMKERVKAAGGRVDGVFRFTHSWNQTQRNASLMDLHVFLPGNTSHRKNGCDNSYGNNQRVGWNNRKHIATGGIQDVDYTDPAPEGYIPIENITFPSTKKMPEGTYLCAIHNWNFRGTGGEGQAEIEINKEVYNYTYPATKHHEWVNVAQVTLKDGTFTIKHLLPEQNTTQDVWGIPTEVFSKVTLVMNSPNHWDGEETGNKHYFFILENCINPDSTRGIYNEFLNKSLTDHRKTFEMLGGSMKVPTADAQLSGVGFSTTKRDHVFCKVTGAFSRTIKIMF